MEMSSDREWLKRMADREDEVGSVNVGNPAEAEVINFGLCQWQRVREGCYSWGPWGLLQDEWGWWVLPCPSEQKYGPFDDIHKALEHAAAIVG